MRAMDCSRVRGVRTLLVGLLMLAASALALDWNPGCIQEPVGFGRGTFGGEGGEVVVPQTIKELKQYLKDDVPRVVLLNRTFDFTGSEGTATREGCVFLPCGRGRQYSLAESDTCDGRQRADVTFDVAGISPLNVGSFKTIAGVEGRGVIRGKGLKVRKAQQVIIRDLSIVDINPAVIWGGDALVLNGVEQAWIHNVTFKNIGRQFLVTYQTRNVGVTVSSCTFDGRTKHSAFCDGKHYWVWLFWGTDDRITLVNNKVINTSGRLPHAGGHSLSQSFVHLVGNVFDSNSDVALEPWDGSFLLVEGNSFRDVRRLVNERAANGHLFLVSTAEHSASCEAALGERCLPNEYRATRAPERCDAAVLDMTRDLDLAAEAVADARRATCACAPLTRRLRMWSVCY